MPIDLNDLAASAEWLNKTTDDLLRSNLRGTNAMEHIRAAEGLLALYEQSALMQMTVTADAGGEVDGEGALELVRRAAEMHIAIAVAMRS